MRWIIVRGKNGDARRPASRDGGRSTLGRSGRFGLWTYAFRQPHRLVGAVFELDGHEHHFAVAEILKVVHLELAFAVGLVARLAGLVGVFDGAAVVNVLTAV